MLNIAICDDEVLEIKKLTHYLQSIMKKHHIVAKIDTYASGVEFLNMFKIKQTTPDIIYLDIHMPLVTGLEVAKELRKEGIKSEIIFNSKSKPEVFKSFDVDAFHYIVKDETSDDRQEEIFLSAYNAFKEKQKDYMFINIAGENVSIPIERVRYFIVKKNLVNVFYGKEILEFYSSLNKISDILLEKEFIRVNKNTLINLNYINKYAKQEILMRDGKLFPVGRVYRKEVENLLEIYFNKKEVLKI
ncbi:MAG: LytTR family DNA-binding domain-containing protein [Lachnospiraceae bacterium]|jgi:DNA-binding LytR/AlgR family response regulator|nr:LytTR family DNA-binding domain-containing protein [Lachnospiraceae bacterium]